MSERGTGGRSARWLGIGLAVVVVAAVVGALIVGRGPIAAAFADRERLAALVRGAGAWGPLVVVGLVIAQVFAAPIPGTVIDFVAGYVYGFWAGALFAWLGLILGSMAAMSVARLAGRPLVERFSDAKTLARLDRYAHGQGLRFFFLVFVLPFLPDNLCCFVAGLTPLPLSALFLVLAVGRIPGVVAAVWLGAYAEQLSWPAWAAVGALALLGALLVWRYGDRLEVALLRRVRRTGRDR